MAVDFSSPSAYKRSLIIKAFANRIRLRYFRARANWELFTHGIQTSSDPFPMPKYDGNPSTDKPSAWEKAAILCLDKNLNPDLLVEATFHNRKMNVPWPNELISSASLARYNQVIPDLKSQLKDSLLAQQHDALTAWNVARVLHNLSPTDAWEYVLLSNITSLTPLYRYCGAYAESLEQIATNSFNEALEQYLCAPDEYDDVWDTLIPGSFKTEARKIMTAANTVK